MTPEQLETVLQRFSGAELAPAGYALLVLVAVVSSLVGSYAGTYFSERGKNLATRDDLQQINEQLRSTTRTTEEVKAQVSGAAWLKQQVWGEKRTLYVEIVQQLQTMTSSIEAAATLEPLAPQDRNFETECRKREAAYNRAASRVGELTAAGFLLLSKESIELLDGFRARVREWAKSETSRTAIGEPQSLADLANAIIPLTDRLMDALLKSARADLGVAEFEHSGRGAT